jgi:hypothetical protein
MQIDPAKCWQDGAPPAPLPTAGELAEHGALVAFQLVCVRFLRAWLPLAPVAAQRKPGAITYADKRTVAGETNDALRGIGLSMVVSLDSGTRNSATLHSLKLDPLRFAVSVAEAPATNRGAGGTGVTASRAAELAMLCFSGVRIGNGVASVVAFEVGGEEGALQTADVTLQTAYLVPTPASLLAT